jgi:hypothetical protein
LSDWLQRTPRQRLISNAVIAVLVIVVAALLADDGIDGAKEVIGLVIAPFAFAAAVGRSLRGLRELRGDAYRRRNL